MNPVCKKLHIAKRVIVVQAAAGDHIDHNLATTRHYEERREKMPLGGDNQHHDLGELAEPDHTLL